MYFTIPLGLQSGKKDTRGPLLVYAIASLQEKLETVNTGCLQGEKMGGQEDRSKKQPFLQNILVHLEGSQVHKYAL